MVTLAKPLGGGLPLGAVVGGPAVASLLTPGSHGTTFGGNPLACRLGWELLSEIEEKGLVANNAALGAWFGKRLARLAKKSPHVLAVRGRGLMWGIDIDREAGPVQRALLAKGFVVGTARKTTIRLLPPYVIRKPALAAFVDVLAETLEENKP
jgi:acetylornithine/succinyldiaminopimelate/putrescine aminotransferase